MLACLTLANSPASAMISARLSAACQALALAKRPFVHSLNAFVPNDMFAAVAGLRALTLAVLVMSRTPSTYTSMSVCERRTRAI